MSTILCDVDGVVADLHVAWLERYNADYDDDLTVDRIHQWAMQPAVKPECGEKIYDYLHQPDLYDSIPPIEGAHEGVAALRRAGHRVVFLTACVGPEMAAAKIGWLQRHGFLAQPIHKGMRDLVIMQDKGLARGDLLIDDYHGNLAAFDGPGLLLTAPYNRAEHGYERADSWADIPWRVDELLQARTL